MDNASIDLLDVPLVLGRFLVLSGLLSEADILEASRVQKDINAAAILVLLEEGLLSVADMQRVRAHQCARMVSFADALVETGVMTPQGCAQALERLAAAKVRLGEVLVRQGKISAAALEAALVRHRAHHQQHQP